jgi:ubiquinol-cytochrome c reductase cytochrome c1 subunit
MVRVIAFFVGLGFAGVLLISLFSGVATEIASPPAPLASEVFHKEPKDLHLASDGPFGHFDKKQVQRGFQVYSEVCSACHSMNQMAFRDLKGIGYNEAEIKKIASDWKTQVPSLNPDTGEASSRKALPSDTIPAPFPNEIAARAANNNALPPDLTLITKAREGGAAYVYSILTGYQNQPAALLKQFPDAKTPQGLHYNPYFANLNLAMPPPLTSGGQVTYAPGNPQPTVDQMAKDVAAFLVWTGEPSLERRHASGIAVVIFLLFATVLAFLAKKQIWADTHGPDSRVDHVGVLDPENQAKVRRAKAKSGVAG